VFSEVPEELPGKCVDGEWRAWSNPFTNAGRQITTVQIFARRPCMRAALACRR